MKMRRVSLGCAVGAMALTLAAATIARAQDAAVAGASDLAVQPAQAEVASALPAQPVASSLSSADAGASDPSSLPTAANASLPASPDTGSSWSDNPDAITPGQRFLWATVHTVGWQSLLYGVIPAAVGTAENHPREYGPHWAGFGDRYGIRLAGLATSNSMEAGLGLLWHENPRYKPEPEKSFGGRLKSVVYQTFFTRRSDGSFEPAYARYLAIPGSNFLSNTWRVNSEADTSHALERTGYGFAGAMGSNAFYEFWPGIKAHLHL
jgi:hypothetical protein